MRRRWTNETQTLGPIDFRALPVAAAISGWDRPKVV
jgi:hypothetical protein